MILSFLDFIHFTWVDILDILMVAAIIYTLFRWIKGTSAMNIFVAIIILVVVRVLAQALGMKMMSALLGTVIDVGAIAIIVIFQPEVRKFLGNIGRTAGSTLERRNFIEKMFSDKQALGNDTVNEIADACFQMGEQKVGALILIRRKNSLDDIVATGDIVDARVSSRLIMNIFFKNSPLHDGAMVIGGGRIVAARCTLPITERTDLPAHYGMRHKAAVGMSELCDADIIVVSEETGKVSVVRAGQIRTVATISEFKLILQGAKEIRL